MTTSSIEPNAPRELYTELIIAHILSSWENDNKLVSRFYQNYSEPLIRQQIAIGRNSPYYLLGHLAATSDALMPVLRLGEKSYP